MKNKHINHYLTSGDPWAIQDGWLETIHTIANRDHDYQAVIAQRGEPLKNTRTVEKRGSVAVIPLTGVIFPRANLMTELSGATSLEIFALDFNAALNDPAITAIVINADSPGGVTTGINEMSNMIRNASKPVTTYVSGAAASAMYYIAAGSHSIVMDAMAMVGSIGVVTQIRGKNDDGSLEIVSSNAPDKRPDTTTAEGKAVYQKMIDDLESVFIQSVASFRNLTTEQVTAIRGGMLVGQKAVDAGLADTLGSLEGVINQLNNNSTPTTTKRGNPMDLSTLKAEHPALYQAVLDEGKQSMQSDLQSTAASATTTERARISAILASDEAKGRETLAQHLAFNTATTPDDAKAMLTAAPIASPQSQSAAPNPFAQAMAGVGNPQVKPDGTANAEGDEQVQLLASAAEAAAIVNKMRGVKA
jgi:ClpP class serine protease